MNANAIKLAVAVTATAAAARFGPKPDKSSTPEQLRTDLDNLTDSAISQNVRLLKANTELAEKLDIMLDQVRFMVNLLGKYNVPLDEFDQIALQDLFSKK